MQEKKIVMQFLRSPLFCHLAYINPKILLVYTVYFSTVIYRGGALVRAP